MCNQGPVVLCDLFYRTHNITLITRVGSWQICESEKHRHTFCNFELETVMAVLGNKMDIQYYNYANNKSVIANE